MDRPDSLGEIRSSEIRAVAMESTGVYWTPRFHTLEMRKIDVRLVNVSER